MRYAWWVLMVGAALGAAAMYFWIKVAPTDDKAVIESLSTLTERSDEASIKLASLARQLRQVEDSADKAEAALKSAADAIKQARDDTTSLANRSNRTKAETARLKKARTVLQRAETDSTKLQALIESVADLDAKLARQKKLEAGYQAKIASVLDPGLGWEPAIIRLMNPTVFIALMILFGVSLALTREIADSQGMLKSMRDLDYARGVITYLYAVVTIGTAVVLVVSALLGEDPGKQDDARQILGLLLGVFGTIVGFYFGSATVDKQGQVSRGALRLTPPRLDKTALKAGEKVEISVHVSGGSPPYQFSTGIGAVPPLEFSQQVPEDGWISAQVGVPAGTTAGPVSIAVGVKDSAGAIATVAKSVTVSSA